MRRPLKHPCWHLLTFSANELRKDTRSLKVNTIVGRRGKSSQGYLGRWGWWISPSLLPSNNMRSWESDGMRNEERYSKLLRLEQIRCSTYDAPLTHFIFRSIFVSVLGAIGQAGMKGLEKNGWKDPKLFSLWTALIFSMPFYCKYLKPYYAN